jgi:hypothetical protein
MSAFIRTTAANAGGGKYQTEMFTYPEDLFGNGANKYANNWVMININVLSNSAFVNGSTKSYATVELDEAEKYAKQGSNIQSIGATSGQIAAANSIAASAVGALAGGGISALLADAGSAAANIGRGAATGLLVGGATALPFLGNSGSRETKRLAIALQLPMPNDLTTNYSMDWGEDGDMRAFDLALRAVKGTSEVLKGNTEGTLGAMGDAVQGTALGINTGVGAGGLSAATGLSSNPKKEMIFNGVGFRQFRLDYKFYPKSQMEAFKVFAIIKTLKLHMHPEYQSSGKFTFVYPSEFDITFYGAGGQENPWVGRIATSVLTDMTVNYTPDALWASHEDGFPNSIRINMNFKELSILTKSEIEDKGY